LGVGEKEFRIEDFEVLNDDVQIGSRSDLPDSLNKLAHMHQIFGKHDVALFRHALEINEKSLGPVHPSTVTARNNRAALYKTLGQ
jgi:hypothetical protein